MKDKVLLWMIVALSCAGLATAIPFVKLVDTSATTYNVHSYTGTYNVSLPYLYNISGVVYFNETHLNSTVDARNTGFNTNCSADGSCPLIVYASNTSWVTSNQNYNSTDDMFNAVNNGTFYLASNPSGYITSYTDTNASTACSGGEVLYGNGSCGVPAGASYTAGDGLNLAGTVFSHNDSSSQASSDNSGRTYIQDILLDTFGHITSIVTAAETVVNTWWTIDTDDFINSSNTLKLNWTTINATIDSRNAGANTNCSVDGSCPNIAYDSEINKTYVDAQDIITNTSIKNYVDAKFVSVNISMDGDNMIFVI